MPVSSRSFQGDKQRSTGIKNFPAVKKDIVNRIIGNDFRISANYSCNMTDKITQVNKIVRYDSSGFASGGMPFFCINMEYQIDPERQTRIMPREMNTCVVLSSH